MLFLIKMFTVSVGLTRLANFITRINLKATMFWLCNGIVVFRFSIDYMIFKFYIFKSVYLNKILMKM